MKVTRKIIRIDEERCNGCGQCVPSCAEGAIQVIDGKARLIAERYCDGLGACLGGGPPPAPGGPPPPSPLPSPQFRAPPRPGSRERGKKPPPRARRRIGAHSLAGPD